jgi:hypothetical protein
MRFTGIHILLVQCMMAIWTTLKLYKFIGTTHVLLGGSLIFVQLWYDSFAIANCDN